MSIGLFPIRMETLEEIEGALSHERLQPYLDAVGGIPRKSAPALPLEYGSQRGTSTARYKGLRSCSATRSIGGQLSGRYGSAWYTNLDTGLDRGALGRIRQAIADLTREPGSPNDSPLILATLSFGPFWVSLLGSGGRLESGRKANYEMTLWRPTRCAKCLRIAQS